MTGWDFEGRLFGGSEALMPLDKLNAVPSARDHWKAFREPTLGHRLDNLAIRGRIIVSDGELAKLEQIAAN